MYPVLHIGSLSVASFSVAMLAAFFLAAWLASRQARFVGVDPMIAWRLLPWGAAAGVLGAKLYSALVLLPDLLRTGASLPKLGEVWYGGLLCGTAVVTWRFVRLRLPVHVLYDYAAAPVAFGHAIGRIGCFLAGDDYGHPTTLPVGIAFPHGAPPSTAANLRAAGMRVADSIPGGTVLAVHPTQLYEAAALVCIGLWLWRASRRPHRRWGVFVQYLLLYGTWRFGIEFLRVKDDVIGVPVIGALTSAQFVSLALIATGVVLLVRHRRQPIEAAP